MKKILLANLCALLITSILVSCGEEKENPVVIDTTTDTSTPERPKVPTPNFVADSAYQFIQDQVNFGPRVPNKPAHLECAEYLKEKLKSYGAKLTVQEGTVEAFNRAKLNIQNIIGQFNPDAEYRIMLCAHWDTRPFADKDTERIAVPIDGANDGASGVGVLLEIARQIAAKDPQIGVDILFFDAEDYGALDSGMMAQHNDSFRSWCLGSQYWALNPPIENYHPRFGILLDMVGAEDATFPKEGISLQYANHVVQKVWKRGQDLGYSKYFINYAIGGLTDDHTFINQLANIPTIDIIHFDKTTNSFGSFHHTHRDKIDIISKETLQAVGQTILDVVYQGL